MSGEWHNSRSEALASDTSETAIYADLDTVLSQRAER